MPKFNYPTEPLDLQKSLGQANVEELLKAIAIKMCELAEEIIEDDPEEYDNCTIRDLAHDYASEEQCETVTSIQGYIRELTTFEVEA